MSVIHAAIIVAGSFNTKPIQPPGTTGVTTIVQYVAWGVAIACLLGVLFGLAYLGIQNRRGQTPEHLQGIIVSMIAAGAVGVVGGLVGTLVG